MFTGLSVGENTGVVSLECIVQDIATQCIEHELLAREMLGSRFQREETMIECKCLRFISVMNKKNSCNYHRDAWVPSNFICIFSISDEKTLTKI